MPISYAGFYICSSYKFKRIHLNFICYMFFATSSAETRGALSTFNNKNLNLHPWGLESRWLGYTSTSLTM
jgi:hypothetical protein